MTKTLIAITLAATLIATTAHADIQSDIAYCKEYAREMSAPVATSDPTTDVILGGIDVLGSVIAGRNPGYHVSSTARRVTRGQSSAQAQRDRDYRSCMRERSKAR